MLSGDWIPLNLPDQLSKVSSAQLISLGGATEALHLVELLHS